MHQFVSVEQTIKMRDGDFGIHLKSQQGSLMSQVNNFVSNI
jgi:hypothetical protein